MDFSQLIKVVLALGFVLGLVVLVGFIARRLGLHRRWSLTSSFDNRMAVVSSLMIDPRRRLVLIRRDNREHLVLLGATHDLLIESYDAPPPKPNA